MKTEEIKKNLWNLKYQRHLQRVHTFFNAGIASSIGLGALILTLREVEVLVLNISLTFFVFFMVFFIPWIIAIALIIREIKIKKKVTEWIQKLDENNYFNN